MVFPNSRRIWFLQIFGSRTVSNHLHFLVLRWRWAQLAKAFWVAFALGMGFFWQNAPNQSRAIRVAQTFAYAFALFGLLSIVGLTTPIERSIENDRKRASDAQRRWPEVERRLSEICNGDLSTVTKEDVIRKVGPPESRVWVRKESASGTACDSGPSWKLSWWDGRDSSDTAGWFSGYNGTKTTTLQFLERNGSACQCYGVTTTRK